jgi:hypothetical protein
MLLPILFSRPPPPVVGCVSPAGLPVLSIPPAILPAINPFRRPPCRPPPPKRSPYRFPGTGLCCTAVLPQMFRLCSLLLRCPWLLASFFGSADVLGDVSTGTFRPLLYQHQHPSPRCQQSVQEVSLLQFLLAKIVCFCVSALIRNCPTLPEGEGAPSCVAPGCTEKKKI